MFLAFSLLTISECPMDCIVSAGALLGTVALRGPRPAWLFPEDTTEAAVDVPRPDPPDWLVQAVVCGCCCCFLEVSASGDCFWGGGGFGLAGWLAMAAHDFGFSGCGGGATGGCTMGVGWVGGTF